VPLGSGRHQAESCPKAGFFTTAGVDPEPDEAPLPVVPALSAAVVAGVKGDARSVLMTLSRRHPGRGARPSGPPPASGPRGSLTNPGAVTDPRNPSWASPRPSPPPPPPPPPTNQPTWPEPAKPVGSPSHRGGMEPPPVPIVAPNCQVRTARSNAQSHLLAPFPGRRRTGAGPPGGRPATTWADVDRGTPSSEIRHPPTPRPLRPYRWPAVPLGLWAPTAGGSATRR